MKLPPWFYGAEVEAWAARVDEHVKRVQASELTAQQAADDLQQEAQAQGLVAQFGADCIRELLASAFAPPTPEPSIDAHQQRKDEPSAMDVWASRAEAQAMLVEAGELERQDTVDVLQKQAETGGLVRAFGQDEIQRVLSRIFGQHAPPPELNEQARNGDGQRDAGELYGPHGPHADLYRPIEFSLERPKQREAVPGSEDELALQFTARHWNDWRYVHMWGYWLEWDGMRWLRERTLRAVDLARDVCAEAARAANSERARLRNSSAATVAAVITFARADRAHAAPTDLWDGDPWLFNTPGGVVDLRSGKLMPHQRADYITRIAGATPRGACPAWRSFLRRITNNDDELTGYLQRFFGYCLSGLTIEHVLAFGYGAGANGKGVTTKTISSVLGDYATSAPTDMLMATRGEQHPTDIASLRGVRLAIATETEQGRRWAEAKVKNLTGGDKLSARFMRQDFFEFTPSHKLFVTGNHKPGLRSADEAMRRRLHFIPFAVTIPESERDPNLPEKLLAEGDGILAWCVEGCLAWQRIGLRPPAAVRKATEDYFLSADAIGRWLEDCCEQDRQSQEASNKLFGSWGKWAEANGEPSGTATSFGEALGKRGFDRCKLKSGERGYTGLHLRARPSDGDHLV